MLTLAAGLAAMQSRNLPPEIARDGVLDAASRIPSSLGGAIAPGALFTIRGVRLRPPVKAGSQSATVLSANPTEITARMPFHAPSGPVGITTAGSNAIIVSVQRGAVGFYSANGLGWGPAAPGGAWHPGALASLRINGPKPRSVFVGGKVTAVLPGGANEVRFRIPANAPAGCYVPVYAVAGEWVSNTVTISIAAHGSACVSDPYWPLPSPRATRLGVLIASRSPALDELSAEFAEKAPGALPGPFLLPPPQGTCVNYFTEADPAEFLSEVAPSSRGLNAGETLEVIRDGYRKLAPAYGRPGIYRGTLGGVAGTPPFFGPGLTHLRVRGGADVFSFTLPLSTPRPLELYRAEGGDIHWKPVEGSVLIVAESSAICVCLADARAGEFRIPTAMLRHFPHAPGRLRLLYQATPPTLLTNAGGLDFVLALSLYGQTIRTSFR